MNIWEELSVLPKEILSELEPQLKSLNEALSDKDKDLAFKMNLIKEMWQSMSENSKYKKDSVSLQVQNAFYYLIIYSKKESPKNSD